MKEKEIPVSELIECVEMLMECEALELVRCPEKCPGHMYIPYMMNDAIEDYLILTDCTVTGAFTEGLIIGIQVHSVQEGKKQGLIIQKPDGGVVSLWYRKCLRSVQLYQYHRIGHFWRKGEEHWRQLVYMVGTVFDKFAYIGETACNEAERELLPLITFAPFRDWSPVTEELESKYPDSLMGIDCMYRLAKDTGRRRTVILTWFYRKWFLARLPMGRVTKWFASYLNHPSQQPLYEMIYRKLCAASAAYPQRDYGTEKNQEILQLRDIIEQDFLHSGYQGSYPEFQKGNRRVLAAEEQPFTAMDYENFEFKIQFMVSEAAMSGLNAGFFYGRGNRGDILDLDQMSELLEKE